MQTDQHPTEPLQPAQSSSSLQKSSQASNMSSNGQGASRPVAQLPVHSRAAAAQRLNAQPERPERGAYYAVPHNQPNATGWRTKRHIKRKNLHNSNLRYAAVDNIGTKFAMLPIKYDSLNDA